MLRGGSDVGYVPLGDIGLAIIAKSGQKSPGTEERRGSRCVNSQCRLFRNTHKQSAGQFSVFTDERCVAALVVFAKNGC